MPKVSVIVPVYKVEEYLNRCIDSILNQTFTDFELILVDDGSPDSCGKICDEYAKRDTRVVVIHKENGGVADARNIGLNWMFENSQSEYVAFIDSDDWVHKQYLESLYSAILRDGTKISMCSNKNLDTFIDDDTKQTASYSLLVSPKNMWKNARIESIVPWNKLIKRELWKNIRFPAGKLHEDAFTLYKVLFLEDLISYIDDELYYHYKNLNSLTYNKYDRKRVSDNLEARSEQTEFFLEHNYQDLYELNIKETIIFMSYLMKRINDDKDLYFEIKNKRKAMIKKYKKQFNLEMSYIYARSTEGVFKDWKLRQKIKYVLLLVKEKGVRFLFNRFIRK